MKGGIFGTGPAATNGTRIPHQPASGATGRSRSSHLFPRDTPDPPDFAGAGAPCTRPEADPDLWHPGGISAAEMAQADEAITLCVTECPMRAECREWADVIKASSGIWGGEWLDHPGQRRRSA